MAPTMETNRMALTMETNRMALTMETNRMALTMDPSFQFRMALTMETTHKLFTKRMAANTILQRIQSAHPPNHVWPLPSLSPYQTRLATTQSVSLPNTSGHYPLSRNRAPSAPVLQTGTTS